MIIECANKSAGEKLQWFKENVPIHTALAGNEDLIKIDNETGILEFLTLPRKENSEVLFGNYTCKGTNSSTEYRIVRKCSFKILVLKNFNIIYGEIFLSFSLL